MYSFVDRPVESLSNNGRFLLWAMRGWSHAVSRGACPPQMLRCGFAGVRALAALPDFHVAMALLGEGSPSVLDTAPMPCVQISEHEAILLGLWRDFSLGDFAAGRATLALLVGAVDVGPIASAMGAANEKLLAAGFDLSTLAAGTRTYQESQK